MSTGAATDKSQSATPAAAPAASAFAEELANAFLRWPLPVGVCADLCATKQGVGRVGTNLLSFVEAKQMFSEIVIPTLGGYVHGLEMENMGLTAHVEKREARCSAASLMLGTLHGCELELTNAIEIFEKGVANEIEQREWASAMKTTVANIIAAIAEAEGAVPPRKVIESDPNEKKARLFYYDDAMSCWTPAPDRVENLISLDQFPDEEERISIEFKRCDLSDKEMDELPEV